MHTLTSALHSATKTWCCVWYGVGKPSLSLSAGNKSSKKTCINITCINITWKIKLKLKIKKQNYLPTPLQRFGDKTVHIYRHFRGMRRAKEGRKE